MLIMIRLYLQVRIIMFLHTCFYFTTIVQLVTGKNLSLTMFFFWFSFILVSLLEFKSDFCDVKLKNVLLDAVVFSLIFVGSALWYFKVLQSKLQSLTGEIYALLSKLHSALEAEMALTQAQEGAWVNTVFKTISGLVLVIGVCLFAYWFFRGGGDDGGGGTTDITSISTESINSFTSKAVDESASIVTQLPLDDLVRNVITSYSFFTYSEKAAKSLSCSKDTLSNLDVILLELAGVLSSIKENKEYFTISKIIYSDLNEAVCYLNEIQRSLGNLRIAKDDSSALEQNELSRLAEELFKVLETSPDFSRIDDAKFYALSSVAIFYYMLTDGKDSILTLKDNMEWLAKRFRKFLKQGNNYSIEDKMLVDHYLETVKSFKQNFKFWSDIHVLYIPDECTSYAAKFVERFRDMCNDI